MTRKKWYVLWSLPFLAAAAFLLWQGKGMAGERKKETQLWRVQAELSEGEITEGMLKGMKEFSGLEKMWTILETEVSVSIREYTGTSSVQGVDLETYPLTVLQSAGEKQLGNVPLLAAGEDFFEQLQDGEETISKRQKGVLLESLSGLDAQLQLLSENQEQEGEKTQGKFLAVVKESGLYMDQEQMRTWMGSQGIHPRLGKVCLEIRGKTKAEQAEKSLAQAGFTVEKKYAAG